MRQRHGIARPPRARLRAADRSGRQDRATSTQNLRELDMRRMVDVRRRAADGERRRVAQRARPSSPTKASSFALAASRRAVPDGRPRTWLRRATLEDASPRRSLRTTNVARVAARGTRPSSWSSASNGASHGSTRTAHAPHPMLRVQPWRRKRQ